MTNEEAVKIIRSECYIVDLLSLDRTQMVNTALDLAIKALEQQPCEDCISREDAIDVIYDYEYKKDMRKALVELPSVTPKTEWIPASERFPKAGEYVGDVAKYYLVQNEYGDMLVARHTHSEYWEQIYQLQPIGDEIVAWMPLPQPYNAESEEK